MATPEQYAWQQQPNETAKAFQAFVLYRNLEPNERSLQRVASEYARSSSLIRRWSAKFDWIERAALWDDYQEMRRLEARIEEKRRMDERHLKIINATLQKVVNAVQKADVDALARNFNQQILWMTELMRLERVIPVRRKAVEPIAREPLGTIGFAFGGCLHDVDPITVNNRDKRPARKDYLGAGRRPGRGVGTPEVVG